MKNLKNTGRDYIQKLMNEENDWSSVLEKVSVTINLVNQVSMDELKNGVQVGYEQQKICRARRYICGSMEVLKGLIGWKWPILF